MAHFSNFSNFQMGYYAHKNSHVSAVEYQVTDISIPKKSERTYHTSYHCRIRFIINRRNFYGVKSFQNVTFINKIRIAKKNLAQDRRIVSLKYFECE
jgi:hypothetical protein